MTEQGTLQITPRINNTGQNCQKLWLMALGNWPKTLRSVIHEKLLTLGKNYWEYVPYLICSCFHPFSGFRFQQDSSPKLALKPADFSVAESYLPLEALSVKVANSVGMSRRPITLSSLVTRLCWEWGQTRGPARNLTGDPWNEKMIKRTQ